MVALFFPLSILRQSMPILPSGNNKFPVVLDDGLAVEAVYYGSGTLCISSQAGCAVGCPFCASGSRGLHRSLTVGELQQQVEEARRRGHRLLRVTLSGIGDPLHNGEAVEPFLEDCRRQGLPVSLTTTGAPLRALERFLDLPHNGLMISLHAGAAATHRALVPRGPDFGALWQLLDRVLPTLSRRRRRKVGLNYLLLAGVNDSAQELAALATRLASHPELTLHLLCCNPVPGSPLRSPAAAEMDRFHGLCRRRGLNVRRPNRWRVRSEGGCGTLVTHSWPETE